ncbi:hypothetical protein CMI37_34515 [Candidatus Pacearchaeota archaeon]|nr:hypothetical protein [Candidatus Pacearchaeota archaeon]
MVFLKFLLKINIFIGRRIAFLIAKYEAEDEVQEVVKTQKFDLRGMSDRLKNVMLHDQEVIDKRWDICKGCEFLNDNKCEKCGCYMKVKTRVATARCPVGKWEKEYEFIKGKKVNGTQATPEL